MRESLTSFPRPSADLVLDSRLLDDLAASTLRALVGALDREQQDVSIVVYRLLAAGGPVTEARIAGDLDMPASRLHQILEGLPETTREGSEITGHLGLTRQPTAYRFEVDGRTRYTWCAWDALFLPALLGKSASVRSTCPVTAEAIRLLVTPDGVESVEPSCVVLSFRQPEPPTEERSIKDSFCCQVHFFRDVESGERWIADHPGTFLLSLEPAFALGRLLNEARYPDVLRPAVALFAYRKKAGVADE